MQQQKDSKLTAKQQQTRSKLTHIKKEKKENKEKKEKKDNLDGTHATRQKKNVIPWRKWKSFVMRINSDT